VYTEFIIIFIGLGILLMFSIANLILLIVLLKRGNDMPVRSFNNFTPTPTGYESQAPKAGMGGNIVFCKKCATEFDASQKYCPKCGTAR